MDKEQRLKIYQAAREWTIEAGQKLKASLQDQIVIEYKTSVADLVTEKDREIERFFIDKIRQHYPNHFVLGEEGVAEHKDFHPEQETVWVIDPIDGTTNFVHQKRNFSISVGIYVQGEPLIGVIYDPIQDECFHALSGEGAYLNDQKLQSLPETEVEESVLGINSLWLTPNDLFDCERLQSLVRHSRGTRSIGSAALELAYVACGRLEGYITLRLSPWDYAAGLVILREVGAQMTTIHEDPLQTFASRSTVFVANRTLHHAIMSQFLHAPKIPDFKKSV